MARNLLKKSIFFVDNVDFVLAKDVKMCKQIVKCIVLVLSMVSLNFATDGNNFEDVEEINSESIEIELEDVSRVIPITDLTTDMSQQIYLGLSPNIAVEYPEGLEIPFKFKGKIDCFTSINLDPNLSIKLERPCYFRFIKKLPYDKRVRIFSSFDLKKWKKVALAGGREIFSIHKDIDKKFVIETVDSPKN